MNTKWMLVTALVEKEYLVEVEDTGMPQRMMNIVEELVYDDCGSTDIVFNTTYDEKPNKWVDEVIELDDYWEEEDE